MKNFEQEGDKLTLTATAVVTSGDVVVVGNIFGVAQNSAAIGEDYVLSIGGVYRLTKVSTEIWSVGDQIYWDPIALKATTVLTANTLIGVATEAAVNPSTEGKVRFNENF